MLRSSQALPKMPTTDVVLFWPAKLHPDARHALDTPTPPSTLRCRVVVKVGDVVKLHPKRRTPLAPSRTETLC
jgi:hypothetical protein